jgi:prevent-host-death family protein
MSKRYTVAEARDNLAGLVHEAEGGTAVEITRRGKPVAVLLAIEDYERLAGSGRGFVKAYADFRRAFDLGKLAIDPDEMFASARERSAGRDFRY